MVSNEYSNEGLSTFPEISAFLGGLAFAALFIIFQEKDSYSTAIYNITSGTTVWSIRQYQVVSYPLAFSGIIFIITVAKRPVKGRGRIRLSYSMPGPAPAPALSPQEAGSAPRRWPRWRHACLAPGGSEAGATSQRMRWHPLPRAYCAAGFSTPATNLPGPCAGRAGNGRSFCAG